MHWSSETVIKFINIYRKHDVLWNHTNPKYFNKLVKDEAWKEIAQQMDVPTKELKTKIENLNAQLRREKVKMLKVQKQGVKYTTSWYAFEHLQFLLHKKMQRRRSSSEDTNDTQDTRMSETHDLLIPRTSSDILPIEEVSKPKISKDPVRRKRRSAATVKRNSESAYCVVPSTSHSVADVLPQPTTNSDPDQIYANFIATKFRMYSQRTKNVLQYKISNLLFQADNGVFDDDQSTDMTQLKTREDQSASERTRANESRSASSSPESKRTRRNSSEASVEIKYEKNCQIYLDEDLLDEDLLDEDLISGNP